MLYSKEEICMQDIFEEIKVQLSELASYKEENIKNEIVVPLFRQELNYIKGKLDYETKVYDGLSDVTYLEDNKPLVVIETKGLGIKNKELRITDNDMMQLIKYLINREARTVWGILSNGTDYYLFNDDIKGLIKDKIVFHLSVYQKSDQRYFKYFSYDNIFVNKTTSYFAYIARFKMYWKEEGHSESSFKMYQSTLFNFFDYYSQTHKNSFSGKTDEECLCQIQIDDFILFSQKMNEKLYNRHQSRERSYQTLTNNYWHLKTFFETLKIRGDIPHHNFVRSKEEVLEDFRDKASPKDKHILDTETYQIILEHLYNGQNSLRNIAIFLMCSYYGLKRSEVNKLTWDSINLNRKTISVVNRKYKMTELMHYCLQTLFKERTKQRIKCNEVFVNCHVKGGKGLSEVAINDIFYSMRKINDPNHDLKWLCPEKVRESLIQAMFECGYSIESIVCYTGLDMSSISNSISYDKIVEIGKKRLDTPCKKLIHPFQNVVDNFYKQIIDGAG